MPELQRTVISNTTPIIALSIIRKLELYKHLYGEVWIPPAVKVELLAGGSRAGAIEIQSVTFLRTVSLNNIRSADLLSDLDRGEAEVIALALENEADLIIIDERLGRRHAQRLGLSLTGVLGVLLRAKERKLLATVEPEITRLRQAGIRLGDALVKRALQMAGEG